MGKDKKRIVLGFSGGANSIVAASLLNSQDYDVRCVHFHVSPQVRSPLCGCTLGRPLEEIEKLGRQLGLNLKIEDRSDAYTELVVEPLLHARLIGEHEEICLNYHQSFLLDGLEAYRKKIGADRLATGHKLRVVQDHIEKTVQVMRSFETELDQSAYFSRVPTDVLSRLVLPMGEIPSSMVEKIARELKLAHAITSPAAHSSFECIPREFWKGPIVPSIIPRDLFRSGTFRSRPEPIADEHPGIFTYHVGEPIAGHGDRYALEPQFDQRLWVTESEDSLGRQIFSLNQAHWLSPMAPFAEPRVSIRRLTDATPVFYEGSVFQYTRDWLQIQTDKSLRAVAPGETFIFYQGEILLGSGRVFRTGQHGGALMT